MSEEDKIPEDVETTVLDMGDGLQACHAWCSHPTLDDCMLVVVGNRAAATAEFLNRRLALKTEASRVPVDGDGVPLGMRTEQLRGTTRRWAIDQTDRLNGPIQETFVRPEEVEDIYYVSAFSAYFSSARHFPMKELDTDGAPKHLELLRYGEREEDLERYLADEQAEGNGPHILVPTPAIYAVMEEREKGAFPEWLAWTAPRMLAMDFATRQFFDETCLVGLPQFVRGDKARPWLVTHCKCVVPKPLFSDYMKGVQELEKKLLEAHIRNMGAEDRFSVRM